MSTTTISPHSTSALISSPHTNSPHTNSTNTSSNTNTNTNTNNNNNDNNISLFTRRVSFNNLNPDSIDPSIPHILSHQPHDYDYDYDNESSNNEQYVFNNISNLYPQSNNKRLTNNYSYPYQSKKKLKLKSKKLPDPPSKSILKNKLTPQQLDYNVNYSNSTGINYHDTLNDLSNNDSIPRSNDLPILDRNTLANSTINSNTLTNGENNNSTNNGRRKSYSEMTNDELMELDPQFKTTKSKVSNVNQFKFDSQSTYYLPNKKSTTSVTTANNFKSVYASSNENNYKSINLTVKHRDYDLTNQSLNKNQTLNNRTLLTVISGRKHTWNSIDWLFNETNETFLQNGDYLVITSLIPYKYSSMPTHNKTSIDDVLYKKCSNLLNYIIKKLPSSNLKLKITIEFITDISIDSSIKKQITGNKYMLHHIYNQYQPTLIIIGNKSTNLNFKYLVRLNENNNNEGNNQGNDGSKYLIKLSSYIIKYSCIPVLIVGNSTKFSKINKKRNKSRQNSNLVTFNNVDPFKKGEDINKSIDSIESNKQEVKSNPIIKFSEIDPLKLKDGNDTDPLKDGGNPLKNGDDDDLLNSDDEDKNEIKGILNSNESLESTSTSSIPTPTPTPSKSSPPPKSINFNLNENEIKFQNSIENLWEQPINEFTFINIINKISDNSLMELNNYLSIINNTNNNTPTNTQRTSELINSKIHEIYKSLNQYQGQGHGNSTSSNNSISMDDNVKMYKVKSLISYDDELKQDLKSKKIKKIKSNNSMISNGNGNGNGNGSGSNVSVNGNNDNKLKKRKSFWQKIGIKK